MDCDVEIVVDLRAELAEGPWWDAAARQLVFVDIVSGVVHRYSPQTNHLESLRIGQPVGAAVPRASGGLVLALRDGVAVWDGVNPPTMVCDLEGDVPGNRLNDAKCDAAGRLWVGSMASTPAAGSLYTVLPDYSHVRVLGGVTISNGIGWSPDNNTMYYNDSRTFRVQAFDFDLSSGCLSGGRTFARLSPEEGEPDGLTVDADGYVWIATFGGGAVRRYDPAGRLDGLIEFPARKVTSCAFGGTDLDELYVTTAAIDRDAQEAAHEPHAGGVFRCRPGVRGRLDHAFAG
ncbi:SMP-30/gluconolactonase/LRE family protein [Krasilnikovia sp. M28-CT-15]|uniref:SMP-30/gluconolactonase/LRE family protein n=1 Tax=Krasilnikovia sp. M28-CT-15 TaxID=3373540 RepID=UPI003875CC4B